MAKIGILAENMRDVMEMDLDLIEAFIQIQDAEYENEWKRRMDVLKKIFGSEK